MMRNAISFADYKAAVRAAQVLLNLIGNAQWLLRVDVRFRNGQPVLEALVTSETDEVRMCIPRTVNECPVQTRVVAAWGRK